jgi:hypothetical protein
MEGNEHRRQAAVRRRSQAIEGFVREAKSQLEENQKVNFNT